MKKQLQMGIVLGIIVSFAVIFNAAQAYGINQEISLVPDMSAPSGSVYVNVQYNCADISFTGLGFSIHFSSSNLAYNGYDSFFHQAVFPVPRFKMTRKTMMLIFPQINLS